MPADEKAIEEAAKAARHYLDQILLEPLAELGLLFKDNVSFWRFKNQVRMVEKARIILEAKGLRVTDLHKTALPDVIVPLIEAGGNTSDPTLANLFAGLLAASLDPSTGPITHPSFAKVLSELAPLDAKLLLALYQEVETTDAELLADNIPDHIAKNLPPFRYVVFEATTCAEALANEPEEVSLSFENIRRLGLCDEGPDFLASMNRLPVICFTPFGYSFMSACSKNDQASKPPSHS